MLMHCGRRVETERLMMLMLEMIFGVAFSNSGNAMTLMHRIKFAELFSVILSCIVCNRTVVKVLCIYVS